MTHKEMHKLMDTILENVISIRDEGQKEYAHDDQDVFANFNRVANLLEIDKKKVLMTYTLKHVDGIAAYVKGHKSQREDVTGRITDCIVYLMLLWGMIEEENGSSSRKKDNKSMRSMWDSISRPEGGLFMDRGRILSPGNKNGSDMCKVRKKRSGVKKPKKVGANK